MDPIHKPEVLPPRPTTKTSIPHRMSIQCHRRHTESFKSSYSPFRKSKSLPNIRILNNEDVHHQRSMSKCMSMSTSTSPTLEREGSKKRHQQKPKILKKTWDKVKTIIHNPPLGSSSGRRESLRKSEIRAPLQRSNAFISSAPSTPLDAPAPQFEFEEETSGGASGGGNGGSGDGGDERQKIARNYALLQKRLSEELHQRMNECSKSSGNIGGVEDSASSARNTLLHGGSRFPDHLSDEFKKRLEQWILWNASTGKTHYSDAELKEIVPESFSRKMMEWELIRDGGGRPDLGQGEQNVADCSTLDETGVIAGSSGGSSSSKRKFTFGSNQELPQTQHQKELAWLDRQLQKIEVEKKKLEREMNKYTEREERLKKMKEALKNSPSTEVYIKTPTAKCKVEKITEKFARKVFAWEEKQGISPESSSLGLLNPKYYDKEAPETEMEGSPGITGVNEREIENREVLDDKDDGGDGDVEEEEEVLGPLDLINARLKAAEQEETEQDKSVRKAMESVAEALALADEEVVGIVREREGEGRISSTASSCCCSEYEDSFATKNNSGTSNNSDCSELYSKPDPNKLCTNSRRRRSSDAISTPLSGPRSPSLSAFTSDEEGDNGPLLRRVSEEDDNNGGGLGGGGASVSRHSTMRNASISGVPVPGPGTGGNEGEVKDAESQTEVIVRAKQIVVEDTDNDGNDERGSSNGIIFVPTKRIIFDPVVSPTIDSEKVVLVVGERNTNKNDDRVTARFSTTSSSIPSISGPGFRKQLEDGDEDDKDDKPVIVGAIPKRPTQLNIRPLNITPTSGGNIPIQPQPHPYKLQPKTQFHRSFPKMGKIPVWCSPLVARKQMFTSSSADNDSRDDQQGANSSGVRVTTPDDSDFSIDRFLQDSKLLDAAMNACVDHEQSQSQSVSNSSQVETTSKRPLLTSRLPKTNALLPRKYTIGGGYPPRGGGCVLTRSNSFGYPKGGGNGGAGSNIQQHDLLQAPSSVLALAGSNVTLESLSSVHLRDEGQGQSTLHSTSGLSMHSVTKSKSTGSIKSKFGRAFAKVGFGFGGSLSKDGSSKGHHKKFGEAKSEEFGEHEQASLDQDEGEGGAAGGSVEGVGLGLGSGTGASGHVSGGVDKAGTEASTYNTNRRESTGGGGTGEGQGTSGFIGMNPLRRFGSWVSRVGGSGTGSGSAPTSGGMGEQPSVGGGGSGAGVVGHGSTKSGND